MPLLLTQDDLLPLINDPQFLHHLFQVIQDALLQQRSDDLGYLSWLAFPLGEAERRFNINALTTPTQGTSLRIFPVSGGDIHPTRNGFFALLIDNQDGQLQALLATDDLSPLRTAAPIGLASRYLARSGASTLAVLGSGVQARYQLRAICAGVSSLRTLRVFSPTKEHCSRFAAEMSTELKLPIEAMESPQQAIDHADIICITATGKGPVLETGWVKPGALIISITGQGLPSDLVTRVVVPALEGPAVRPSGWDPRPVMGTTGGRDLSTIAATLLEIMKGSQFARQREDDIVLYEQRGSYTWDAALLRWVYNWAVEHQAGTAFQLSSSTAN